MTDITSEINPRLIKKINTECGINSLLYTNGFNIWTPAPISIYPSNIKKYNYIKLKYIQLIWNDIIDKISRNQKFLIKNLIKITKVDLFTYHLLKIYSNLSNNNIKNLIHLGIFRSDYMLHQDIINNNIM